MANDTTNNIMFFENDKDDWGSVTKVPGGNAGSPHHALDIHAYCYWAAP